VAAILAILTYLLEKFGHEPALDVPEGADPSAAGAAGDEPAATTT